TSIGSLVSSALRSCCQRGKSERVMPAPILERHTTRHSGLLRHIRLKPLHTPSPSESPITATVTPRLFASLPGAASAARGATSSIQSAAMTAGRAPGRPAERGDTRYRIATAAGLNPALPQVGIRRYRLANTILADRGQIKGHPSKLHNTEWRCYRRDT